MDLIPQLITGVRIGVTHLLAPSPRWLRQHADQVADQPLSMETGQWSGADDNPSLEEGWIEEVVGGEEELKRRFPQIAISVQQSQRSVTPLAQVAVSAQNPCEEKYKCT